MCLLLHIILLQQLSFSFIYHTNNQILTEEFTRHNGEYVCDMSTYGVSTQFPRVPDRATFPLYVRPSIKLLHTIYLSNIGILKICNEDSYFIEKILRVKLPKYIHFYFMAPNVSCSNGGSQEEAKILRPNLDAGSINPGKWSWGSPSYIPTIYLYLKWPMYFYLSMINSSKQLRR